MFSIIALEEKRIGLQISKLQMEVSSLVDLPSSKRTYCDFANNENASLTIGTQFDYHIK